MNQDARFVVGTSRVKHNEGYMPGFGDDFDDPAPHFGVAIGDQALDLASPRFASCSETYVINRKVMGQRGL
jgi:hypothetical protein